MKNIVKLAGLCLVLIIAAALIPGCSQENVTISQEIDELSLVNMWEEVSATIDVQEGSAELESLLLHADKEGKVSSLSFVFHGRDSKGRPKAYFLSKYTNGEINWRSYESQSVTITRHPAEVFSEIDKLGLGSLELGEDGLSIQVQFQSGDVGYRYAYSDIYHLEGGTLRQLNEIIFHSRTPWCTIGVFELSPLETVVTEDGRTVARSTTVAGPVPPGERTSQIWFLSEDINRAETVEYLELDGEAQAGQVLDIKVGLSLQSSLAKGVSLENVKVQVGKIEKGPVWNPWGGSKYYAGDPCLLVLGDIKNDTSENMTVIGSALGYNADWEPVAWTLSAARIMGQFEYSVPARSSRSFEVPLTYAEDVRLIEIHAASYDSETFFQPPMTSEPMPESELTRITFSKEWLLENDVEPDPGTVEITFPASWLVESPPVSADDECVELTVPTNMLNAHNKSANPEEITVLFPAYYFDGLE
jgi:hypothetical protein